jgi:hypothetical protein
MEPRAPLAALQILIHPRRTRQGRVPAQSAIDEHGLGRKGSLKAAVFRRRPLREARRDGGREDQLDETGPSRLSQGADLGTRGGSCPVPDRHRTPRGSRAPGLRPRRPSPAYAAFLASLAPEPRVAPPPCPLLPSRTMSFRPWITRREGCPYRHISCSAAPARPSAPLRRTRRAAPAGRRPASRGRRAGLRVSTRLDVPGPSTVNAQDAVSRFRSDRERLTEPLHPAVAGRLPDHGGLVQVQENRNRMIPSPFLPTVGTRRRAPQPQVP